MKLKLPLLAFTCLALLAPGARAVTYNQGDLLMGFHATGGQGADQTYVINIGQGGMFRDMSGSLSVGSNIGGALSTIFGANWFTRTDLFFGVAGSPLNSISGSFNGDPTRTAYASRVEDVAGVQSAPWVISTSSARAQASTDMVTLQGAFLAAASNQNPTSADNDWSDFNPPTTSISFSSFNPSIEGNPGQVLDLYRVLNSTAGAVRPGTVGTGQFLGTFRLSPTGDISFAAVPEPSTYALLACGGLAALITYSRRRSHTAPVA